MRLVQVAKFLGMTGQELRRELTQVDFGVKPTDREVPDALAHGILRFIARKHNKQIDIEAIMSGTFAAEEEEKPAAAPEQEVAPAVEEVAPAVTGVGKGGVKPTEGLNVLRKLTLDDVPKAAIALQQEEMKKKKDKEELAAEKKRELRAAPVKPAEQRNQVQIKKKEGVVLLPTQLTVKEFAEKTGIQVPLVVQALMKNGIMATINQGIDFDTAAIIAAELGVDVQKEQVVAKAEDIFTRNLEELLRDEPENLETRPPIVVVMGHVDHGKTSILDAIRKTDVVAGEAGGITQHIGAYQIIHQSPDSSELHKITFLDTPGHEAFTAMRARGAQVTDIAIIVVAADEGIKPTTVEAINHAKDAGVPVIVAINKIDKPNADPDRVKGELAGHGLQTEEWGGQTPTVLCSAVTKQGIPELLDQIIYAAALGELKANPNRSAVATVIESNLDAALGPLATVIVNTGTLRASDVFICGSTSGRVRAMMDAHGQKLADVPPSGAVRVTGFGDVPKVGDILQVVPSEKHARALLEGIQAHEEQNRKRSFADLVTRLSEGKLTQLKVVLKADAQGSLEALQHSLAKQSTEEISVKVIHAAVGAVSESDVMMAAASEGVVLGFHVLVPPSVQKTAEREGVQVRQYEVIYALLDDVEALVKGLVVPVEEEQILGHLEVKGVFFAKKNEQIVGGKVTDGIIKRLPFRLMRDGEEVGTGRITSLKHVDKDIKEAKEGTECGMRIESTLPVLEKDVFEVYLRELKRK